MKKFEIDIFDQWWPDLDRELTLREKLSQARPKEQIEILRPLAEKYIDKYDGTSEAEGLLLRMREANDSDESRGLRFRFDAAIERMLFKIEAAQNRPLVEKGQAFTDGCKKGRIDALGRVTKETREALLEANKKEPSAEDLWNALPVGPVGSVIQEIEDGVIYWQNDAGAPKETSFKAFQNRLPKIKKS